MEGDTSDLEALLPYATDIQARYIRAVLEHNSQRKASRALDVHPRTLQRSLASARRTAAQRGWSPPHDMTHTVPEGFNVKGVSTLYNGDGEVAAQWVKSTADQEQIQKAQQLFVSELCEQARPKNWTTAAPKNVESDLMVGYPIGDHHFGMFSWGAETGADYDLKIAKELLASSVDYLVKSAPPARIGLLANLGDFLHVDNRTNRTPSGGNTLDVDSRYGKIIEVAAFGLAHAVERLLQKHEEVWVDNVPGNHDPDSTAWLSLVMGVYFRNEPRVKVGTAPGHFRFRRFGKNMVMMFHGDTVKLTEVSGIMAAYEPVMWGDTTYRVAWGGHVHHKQELRVKEERAAKVETFGVLPPVDGWAKSKGYAAERTMQAIAFHERGGEIGRTTYNVALH